MTVGRVAVEKNLPAFLSLDLPGTKVVIGAGPQQAELKRRFPAAKFLGQLDNGILAAHLAAADVFVFPSLTDTFGIVQLEALASGVPVAAFPVTGPGDVIGNHPVGVLHADLRTACMQALWISREACREFALRYSWENSARQFISHARKVAVAAAGENTVAAPLQAQVHSEPQSLVPESDRATTRMTHEHSV
jgi:glycosyltransferase involved in cell wall biosynthesis